MFFLQFLGSKNNWHCDVVCATFGSCTVIECKVNNQLVPFTLNNGARAKCSINSALTIDI
jgi:hypothetical protein